MCVWSSYFLQYLAWSELWKAFQRLEVVMGIPLSLEDMEAFVLLFLFLHGRLKDPAWATCHENGGLEPPYLEIRGHKVVELDWSSIPSTNYRKNLRADGTSQCKVVRRMLFVPWLLGQIQSLGLSQCLFWGLKPFTGSFFLLLFTTKQANWKSKENSVIFELRLSYVHNSASVFKSKILLLMD